MNLRLVAAMACSASAIACGSSPTAPSTIPLTDLASAATRIVVDGRGLTLTPFLWRDFMPLSPPDGQPLAAVLRIKTDDGSPVPMTVSADACWVVRGGEVWSAAVEQRSRAETAPDYEVAARNGPKWDPNITVDVVVRLRAANGASFLLRAANAPIVATR